ncbi:sulfurtransferase TusA family protein [Fusibacter tunisiensis]|uniref:TusA-related sulfurtransferase n=1 Tax=Fusibacter tunisiensis TaxID=1008308 RepID=A0ABS2MRQ9_9FIRM|nr:sulfurtransferase TusA family protein [Fusibacter tunisiensis]MBM7562104.1 TusA-related sulfurtransferase [Fusibacter tunisiensis]
MKKLDCFGDICPIPLLKMNHEIETLKPGESFQMVVDHSCVIESIRESLAKSNIEFKIDEVLNGVWEITLKKTI